MLLARRTFQAGGEHRWASIQKQGSQPWSQVPLLPSPPTTRCRHCPLPGLPVLPKALSRACSAALYPSCKVSAHHLLQGLQQLGESQRGPFTQTPFCPSGAPTWGRFGIQRVDWVPAQPWGLMSGSQVMGRGWANRAPARSVHVRVHAGPTVLGPVPGFSQERPEGRRRGAARTPCRLDV